MKLRDRRSSGGVPARHRAGWLHDHLRDPYVQRAQASGYRSRAVFKLAELAQRDRLLSPGMTVIDLGAAPGGWSQLAAERVGQEGRVIAVDVLAMDPIAGVEWIGGDFETEETFERLLALLGGGGADVVLSDLAPNLTGVRAIDQPRAMALAERAADLGARVLRPGGHLVVKVFQGEGVAELNAALRRSYRRVVSRKPEASRQHSREAYVCALGRLV